MNRCPDPEFSAARPATSRFACAMRPFALAATLSVSGWLAVSATLAVPALLAFGPASAQAQNVGRPIPKDVKFGWMVVIQPPEVTMDGEPDRLSPGSRIRHTNNLLVLSGTIVGQRVPVIYRRDTYGLIHEAWLLSPEEAARLDNSTGAAFTQALNTLLGIIFGTRR